MTRSILHPKWLLLVNTLPIVLMGLIYYGNYQIIHTLLSGDSIDLWISFSVSLAILWLGYLVFALYQISRGKLLSPWYGVITLPIYVGYVYTFYNYSDDVIPRGIPQWMMPEDISLYVGTFIMPTMAHALFTMVVSWNTLNKKRKPLFDFGYALLVPVAAYLFFQLVLPLWQRIDHDQFSEHAVLILGLTGTVVFLFFLCRGIYLLGERKSGVLTEYAWTWKIILSIFFPLLGLYINSTAGYFGDFSNYWFYVLAIVNGIVTSLPSPIDKSYRLALFILRCITYPFIFYFFIVFLPYLPLSVVAIIAVGSGFLMLTPLALMFIQTQQMLHDLEFLSTQYSKRIIYAALFAGIIFLPVAITGVYLKDRISLHAALNYIYTPDYNASSEIDTDDLKKVLKTIKTRKSRGWLSGKHVPYLSTYYNWLVLDNLTLSNDKMKWLENVYIGKDDQYEQPWIPLSDLAEAQSTITNLVTSTQYDEKQKAWRSEIELDITNASHQQSEFVTSFELPEGSWISNYYLWIEGEKVYGLLAEKKTATWIYQQITSYRRDPGILYYLTGNRIALRVFPLEGLQTRKTGFEIVHKEPAHFKIDHLTVNLKSSSNTNIVLEDTYRAGKGIYISAAAKAKLPRATRTPQYHFILDCSSDKKEMTEFFIGRMEAYALREKINLEESKIFLTNAYSTETNWKDLRSALNKTNYEGGFFLERSIEKILIDRYKNPSDTYPIIIAISDSISSALVRNNFANLKLTFPESDHFYFLENEHRAVPYSLLDPTTSLPSDSLQVYPVVAWPDAIKPKAFLRIDQHPSVIYEDDESAYSKFELNEKDWTTALALHGDWLDHVFHPEKTDEVWLGLIQQSFKAQVMTPVTSFISLENEAQKMALLKKQQEVLNAKSTLDIGEETRMSEPGLFVILLLIAVLIAIKRILSKKYSFSSHNH